MTRGSFDIVGQLDALRRYARVLVRQDDEADDLVQTTFLRAHERIASFRQGSDIRVWLMSIMHNQFIDQQRSNRASAAREQDWLDMNPGFVQPSGETAARLAQLRAAFLSLPQEQRASLHLVAVEGLSVAEAADVLAIPQGTVMSRLGRARAAIRDFEDNRPARKPGQPLRIVGGRDD